MQIHKNVATATTTMKFSKALARRKAELAGKTITRAHAIPALGLEQTWVHRAVITFYRLNDLSTCSYLVQLLINRKKGRVEHQFRDFGDRSFIGARTSDLINLFGSRSWSFTCAPISTYVFRRFYGAGMAVDEIRTSSRRAIDV